MVLEGLTNNSDIFSLITNSGCDNFLTVIFIVLTNALYINVAFLVTVKIYSPANKPDNFNPSTPNPLLLDDSII